MTMRLDRYLHECGAGTRREAYLLVRAGRVTVGGVVARDGARHVGPGEVVAVDGAALELRGPRIVAFHKPAGLVTATRDRLPTIYSALPFGPGELLPVGRLDRETEGLLLLTDDGVLLHRLTAPKWHVEKEYLALVAGEVTPAALARLRAPMDLGRGESSRGAVVAESPAPGMVRLTIDEGRYHQVRRMLSGVGLAVTRLTRVRVGPIALGDLPPRQSRELTAEEAATLRAAVKL